MNRACEPAQLWTSALPFALRGSMTPVHDPETDSVYVSDGWGTAFASICLRRIALADGSQCAFRTRTDVRSLCFDEGGGSLLAVCSERLIELDRRTGAERARFESRVPRDSNVSLLLGRTAFLASSMGPSLAMYDLDSGKCARRRVGSCHELFRGAAGDVVVASGLEGVVWSCDPSSRDASSRRVRTLAQPGPFRAAAYARPADLLALGLGVPHEEDASGRVQSFHTWSELALLRLATGERVDVRLDRDFESLWPSADGSALWLASGRDLRACRLDGGRLEVVGEQRLEHGTDVLLVLPERGIALTGDLLAERGELRAHALPTP